MEQKDLKAIKQQLQYALDELQDEKPDIDLLHDWISDPLQRVKKLIITDVVVSEAEVCEHHWLNDTFDVYGFVIEKVCEFCGKREQT